MAKFSRILILLFLYACSPTNVALNGFASWMKADDKIRVLATTAIVQDLVEKVGGEEVKVLAMIGANQDPHSYEIVKGDGEKFTYADLVFANGLMLEHSGSMQYQLKRHKYVCFLGDELFKRAPQEIITVNGQLDPHIWMDVSLWSKCIDIVLEKLVEKDPHHKEVYEKNAKEAKEKYALADSEIKEKMNKIRLDKRYLVTSHDAFNYFVRRYFASKEELENNSWRVRMQALQGLAPDEQISVLQVKEIVDHVCKYNIEVIFPESNLSKDSLEKVKEACEKRGRKIRLAKSTLYGDTLGGKSYLEMMIYDAKVLEDNL
jgi:manganese/zinc/iron transport system substrate-binding protein